MKRLMIMALVFFATNACAIEYHVNKTYTNMLPEGILAKSYNTKSMGISQGLNKGLTFFVDYYSKDLDAFGFSRAGATFTASRSTTTPATYIDSNGVIQLVTSSNTPRFVGGYYDTTGFHSAKGLMIEAAGTNLHADTYFVDGLATPRWLATVGVGGTAAISMSSTYTNPYLGGQVLKYVGSKADDRFARKVETNAITIANSTKYTVSALVRGSGTIRFRYINGASAGAWLTQDKVLSDTWMFISESFTSGVADAGASGGIGLGNQADGAVTCYIAYIQIEASPYATSFIPTTTAALTRNAETLTYPISGNRTAAQETIAIKFMPLGGSFANDGVRRVLIDTDTKRRVVHKSTTGVVLTFIPNNSDDSGTLKANTTTPLLNTSYVHTATCVNSPSSYAGYLNGTQEGTTGSTAWTLNAWGSNFYIGSNSSSTEQINGLIQKVAIHGRPLSADEVLEEKNLLNQ